MCIRKTKRTSVYVAVCLIINSGSMLCFVPEITSMDDEDEYE